MHSLFLQASPNCTTAIDASVPNAGSLVRPRPSRTKKPCGVGERSRLFLPRCFCGLGCQFRMEFNFFRFHRRVSPKPRVCDSEPVEPLAQTKKAFAIAAIFFPCKSRRWVELLCRQRPPKMLFGRRKKCNKVREYPPAALASCTPSFLAPRSPPGVRSGIGHCPVCRSTRKDRRPWPGPCCASVGRDGPI